MDSESSQPLQASDQTPVWIHRLACVTAASTFILICVGGLVKSKEAGLSVPGWPFSYDTPDKEIAGGLFLSSLALGLSWLIFRKKVLAIAAILSGCALAITYYSHGPQNWTQIPNIRAEHGHRLIAGTVGLLTAILAGALWDKESRSWVRRLGAFSLLAVICQAILGGITVLKMTPPWISAGHACLAQAFFGMVCCIALVTSRFWFEPTQPLPVKKGSNPRRIAKMLMGALYLQIALGAALRHTPPDIEKHVTVFAWHLGAHLFGFLFVAHAAAKAILWVVRNGPEDDAIHRWSTALGGLLFFQVILGIGALLVRFFPKNDFSPDMLREWTATGHVAVGALIFGTAVGLSALIYRGTPKTATSPEVTSSEVATG